MRRDRRVGDADRVREVHRGDRPERAPVELPERGRLDLAESVDDEVGYVIPARTEHGTTGVREVVRDVHRAGAAPGGELPDDLVPRAHDRRSSGATPGVQNVAERPVGRPVPQSVFVVEVVRDDVDVTVVDTRLGEEVSDAPVREVADFEVDRGDSLVLRRHECAARYLDRMFDPKESFFLGDADNRAVVQQCGGSVIPKTCQSEHPHSSLRGHYRTVSTRVAPPSGSSDRSRLWLGHEDVA